MTTFHDKDGAWSTRKGKKGKRKHRKILVFKIIIISKVGGKKKFKRKNLEEIMLRLEILKK